MDRTFYGVSHLSRAILRAMRKAHRVGTASHNHRYMIAGVWAEHDQRPDVRLGWIAVVAQVIEHRPGVAGAVVVEPVRVVKARPLAETGDGLGTVHRDRAAHR